MAYTPKRERYLTNQEKLKSRKIFKILSGQKKAFIEFLLSLNNKSKNIWETKATKVTTIDELIDSLSHEIPDYLVEVLPAIMNEGAKEPIDKFRELLPVGYSLSFNLPSSPASKYLRDLEDLMLSDRDGSILKTTRDELRRIMANGLDNDMSLADLAKQIEETDPFVFSMYRAKLIAVNEVGRAFGWANHQPGEDLADEGYIMEKRWATSHDDRVREAHTTNERAGSIPFKSIFPGTGDTFAPSTHDINCRCTSTYQIVALKTIGGIIDLKGKTLPEIKSVFIANKK